MFIGISVILVLMAMGGIIAYLGDKIGTRVGKRRLTLFGLRPKYTSVIITICSGTLIACLTVATMAVLNENVRVALFGLSRLHAEMDRLNEDIAAKNEEREILINSISAIREGTVIFRAGQVINTAVVDAHMDKETAAGVLANILNDINGALCERLNVQDKDAVVIRVRPEDFEKAVTEIVGAEDKKLIRIMAAGNIILGESAVVTFDIHDDVILYKEGNLILEKNLDEYQNFQNLDLKLLRFLKEVNQVSQEKGVLPDPITGDVGELDSREMMDTLQRIHDLDGKCILRAIAKKDVTTAGPVVITVKVIPQ